MKKRVLQFIGSFHQGGSEQQAVALTRMLHEDATFEVFAATLNNDGVLRADFDKIGVPAVPEFPLTSFYNTNFVRQVRRCSAFLLDNRIDLVHTHDFYTNVFGMAAATLAGVRCRIASKRETGGMRTATQDFVERLAFGRAGAVISNSAAVRDYLVSRGVDGAKIDVIYNGIGPGRFDGPHRDRLETCLEFGLLGDDKLRYVVMVANLRHDVKNVPMLLRMAKRLASTHPDVHFVVAGEGELLGSLKGMAVEMGIADRLHFIGRCTDVPALLAAADVCVLTSTAEGFSNSILEYMAAGKPVVATDVGGAAECVAAGETGYLVAPDDDEAMSARLTGLLDDRELAKRAGAAGRAIVSEKFSARTQLAKTIAVYSKLLERD